MKREPEPSIHAIHGFIGAGKTTLARQLEQRLPALRLNADEWMVELYGPDPAEGIFRPGLDRVNLLIRHLAERALYLGLNVVLDDGYWTRASRDELRAWAEHLGVALRLHALNLPEDEARNRVARRNAESGALFIAPETFDLFLSHFEPLGPDEPREPPEPCELAD